ncbi:dephospho-CoA kinase [Succinivibrio faecicola]|uniref:Dephospho-CoA kinase n=1 Tax=Succinivibrio faecicola TaxID=2820300 RepID=A0ABS7DJG9_9GAMM|nr:dephospho-CoA kinase [Succinivibrio faecicola]MBW7570995.1 dephospho-CoA kinase [Succinivibrio faecicola]
MTQKKFIVGLTGGIASGKSAIATLFKRLGVNIVDADQVARDVVQKGTALLEKIRLTFGDEVILSDGSLNRKRLREIVFAQGAQDKLKTLNELMRNDIQSTIKKRIDEALGRYVIVMVPLLFEHHLENTVDRILVVDVDETLQKKRLCQRDNIDLELAENMIKNQVSRAFRLEHCHDLIKSDDSPLDKRFNVVLKLHKMYQQMAEQKN